MTDGQKSCLGFIFLIAAMVISVLSLIIGGFNMDLVYNPYILTPVYDFPGL